MIRISKEAIATAATSDPQQEFLEDLDEVQTPQDMTKSWKAPFTTGLHRFIDWVETSRDKWTSRTRERG